MMKPGAVLLHMMRGSSRSIPQLVLECWILSNVADLRVLVHRQWSSNSTASAMHHFVFAYPPDRSRTSSSFKGVRKEPSIHDLKKESNSIPATKYVEIHHAPQMPLHAINENPFSCSRSHSLLTHPYLNLRASRSDSRRQRMSSSRTAERNL
jgi:hypothetical protein